MWYGAIHSISISIGSLAKDTHSLASSCSDSPSRVESQIFVALFNLSYKEGNLPIHASAIFSTFLWYAMVWAGPDARQRPYGMGLTTITPRILRDSFYPANCTRKSWIKWRIRNILLLSEVTGLFAENKSCVRVPWSCAILHEHLSTFWWIVFVHEILFDE